MHCTRRKMMKLNENGYREDLIDRLEDRIEAVSLDSMNSCAAGLQAIATAILALDALRNINKYIKFAEERSKHPGKG